MMKCRNCRAEIEDEAMYCPECGTRVERDIDTDTAAPLFAAAAPKQPDTQIQFCPNCGAKAEAGAEFCENCGHRLKEEAPAPAPEGQKKKNFRLPLVIGVAAAAAVLLAVGLFAVPRAVKAIAGAGHSGDTQEIFYVKDRGFYGASLKSARKKPVEYTDSFASADALYNAISGFYGYQFLSQDGEYRFFIKDVNDGQEMTYTLYSQKGAKDPVKVDSSIQDMYRVTDDNKVVYMKNDNLYVSNLKDKTKICSDVDGFMLDKAGKNVLWGVDGGDEDSGYDIYYQDLAMKKDREKLISNGTLIAASPDLNTLLIMKEDALYLVRDQGAGEKLVSDVDKVLGQDLTRGTFFYLGLARGTVNAMDFVNDDLAASDARITEPVRANYERSEVVGEGYWAYTRTVTDDRYYEDLNRYNQKLERDSLRREISGMKIDSPYRSLYYYSNGEAQLITDRLVDWTGYTYITDEDKDINKNFTSYQPYKRAKDSLENKVKLSDISYAGNTESMVSSVSGNDVVTCLFAGGKETELDMDGKTIYNTYEDVKNNQLYCLLVEPGNYGSQGDLATISLGGENAGKIETHDSDVDGIELVSDGNVYYVKDVNERNNQDIGDLYCNGERVVTDVSRHTVIAVPDSPAIICVADPSRESGDGSLMYLKGSKAKKIADDVSDYHAFGEDSIAMLTDYNYNRYKGELQYYNGKELRKLDSDVRGFFY